jgi:hypothetical protein
VIKGVKFSVAATPEGFFGGIAVSPALALGRSNNLELASDEVVQALAGPLLDTAIDLFSLDTAYRASELRVRRLDLSCNLELPLGITAPDLLSGLMAHSPSHGRFKRLYQDGHGRLETVYLGNDSRLVRIYDKAQQSDLPEAEGVVRWECELNGSHLDRIGIWDVASAGPAAIERERQSLWTWSGLDKPVALKNISVGDIAEFFDGTIPPRHLWTLLGGYLLGFPGAKPRSRLRYNAQIRQYGLASFLEEVKQNMTATGAKSVVEVDYTTRKIRAIT